MIQIGNARSGRDGFSKKLLAEAEEVLGRAGDRMRMSSAHTVVVLAGGTGSGKSSLFNRLAGADFSAVGVTRPVTKDAHACIWGDQGSGALLDWLAIPGRNRYSRASALDSGEDDLAGLLLLDLPDHDSVMTASSGVVDRLVTLADVMIWVLDPQKYADAAIHRRFLVPLAGHSDVLAVVLNQSDLLESAQIDDCLADLRRLLDTEHLPDVPILVTSAVTGAGFEELRKLLVDGVATHRAAAARIAADIDGVAARFKRYGGTVDTPVPAVPPDAADRLTERFLAAAGVSAVGDALRTARDLRAADFVGWPVAWLVQRLSGRDPLRKVRLSMLWDDLKSVTAGPSGAQQAEIDNALTEFGDRIADPLPLPWSGTVRTAARARADQIPAAIGNAIGEALPAERAARWWWWLGDMWQGLLAGAAGLGLLWLAFAGFMHAFGLSGGGLKGLYAVAVLPWVAVGIAAALLLGWLTELVSMRVVRRLARREDASVGAAMARNIAEVGTSMVVMPAQQEMSELERYRDALRIASSPTPVTVASSGPAAEDGNQ
jgi:GTP-binding protein EngB required for normal cell division